MPKRKTTDKEYADLTKSIDVPALQENIREFFADFPDPRKRYTYPPWYLVLILLCGYLSGCNTITDIAHFAEVRNGWLNDLLGLKFSRVSYDTIWWFLARVKPEAFKNIISRWLEALPENLKDQLLAIDGKRLRGVSDNDHIRHIVELFATESSILIAQEHVPNKGCERKVLPELLKAINVKGAIVSMDAHFTYVDDLTLILEAGADYIVGIKGNQGTLEAEVRNYFDQAHAIGHDHPEFALHTTVDKAHGRLETRQICVTGNLDWLPDREKWGMQSLVEVRSERVIGDKISQNIFYYGSSRKGSSKEFARWIRGHWKVENNLHYVADVTFGEDASLADAGHTAENMALLRRLTMNIIKTIDPKRGLADARRSAAFDPNYMRGILSKLFTKKR